MGIIWNGAWGESPIPTVSRWAALINDSPSVQPLPSHLADPPTSQTWAHPQAYWNPGKGILTPHPFSLPLTSQPTLLGTTLLEYSVFFWNLVEFLKAEEATWPSVEVSIISKSQCSQLLGSSLFGQRPNGHYRSGLSSYSSLKGRALPLKTEHCLLLIECPWAKYLFWTSVSSSVRRGLKYSCKK